MRIDANFQRIPFDSTIKYEFNKNLRPSTSISINDYQNSHLGNQPSDISRNRNYLVIPQNQEYKNARSFETLPHRE